MTYFINYSVSTGLSIDSFRSPNGYANGDVTGLVEDIFDSRSGNCPLEGALDALKEGALKEGALVAVYGEEAVQRFREGLAEIIARQEEQDHEQARA